MIEVSGLSKRYGNMVAVDRLSFRVRPGLITGFLGPNGAGKSTTMRMMLGLDTPTHGSATVNGKPYRSLHYPLRTVGALLDANAVHGGLTARQHLRILAASSGLPDSRVLDVLEQVGLAAAASKRIRGFSLGMKQRLGIAAALLGDPPILLLDEPGNGLDADGILWIRELMKAMAAEGRTVFVSSHGMGEMALVASHLIVIGRGRLLADTDLVSLISDSQLDDFVVRSPASARLAALLTARGAIVVSEPEERLAVTGLNGPDISAVATTHGIAVHELTHRRPSLEEAYLKLTSDAIDFRASDAKSLNVNREAVDL